MKAVPIHTIVRYQPSEWKPVEVKRFRLFVNATHEEVTGDKRGVAWNHDWSCESLNENGWRINGRNTWRTYEEALIAVSQGSFGTFEEARAESLRLAEERRSALQRQLRQAERRIDEINRATAPELPGDEP